MQQINFTEDVHRAQNAGVQIINANITMFFIIQEVKETAVLFSQGNVKALEFCFCFNIK